MTLTELWRMLYIAMVVAASAARAGCSYNQETKGYSCGEHGLCKKTELNEFLVLRYCVCDKGYSGKEVCSEQCEDCCQQMADQCYNRRVRAPCKIPRCLDRVLRSRKCPKDSANRKDINQRIWSYLSFCNKEQR